MSKIDEAGKAKVMEIGTNKPIITEEVIDEVCPNEKYSEAKSISTTSKVQPQRENLSSSITTP